MLSIGVGAALIVAAALMAWLAIRMPAVAAADPSESSARPSVFDSWVVHRRKRRLQVATLLGLVGFMISLGDAGVIPWERYPLAFAFYWLAVLCLTCWILLIALGDLISARLHGRIANSSLERLKAQQNELLETAERLRQHRDGRSPPQN